MQKFLAVFFLGFPSIALAACPSELAIYTHLEDGDFSLSLSKPTDPKVMSDIEVAIKGPEVELRYEFTVSNGYARYYLVSVSGKANEDSLVSFFGKDMKLVDAPRLGQPAPEFMYAADLGIKLYYATKDSSDLIFLPDGMWKLSGCAK
jgi:hypothetical protein